MFKVEIHQVWNSYDCHIYHEIFVWWILALNLDQAGQFHELFYTLRQTFVPVKTSQKLGLERK